MLIIKHLQSLQVHSKCHINFLQQAVQPFCLTFIHDFLLFFLSSSPCLSCNLILQPSHRHQHPINVHRRDRGSRSAQAEVFSWHGGPLRHISKVDRPVWPSHPSLLLGMSLACSITDIEPEPYIYLIS